MSTQSYSSIGAGRRRGTAHDDIDRSFYTVGQTLASIVNDPRAPTPSGGFWGLAGEATQLPPPPPPLDPVKYPPVSKADLQRYIDVVHGAYEKFERDRQSLEAFDAQHQGRRSSVRLSSSSSQQQGEPFMVAVQAVPTQFFQEGFFHSWDEFFKQYCEDQSAEEVYEQIDLLNRNLDVVELQLLREVASRSSSFFQAASTLQGLQGHLSEAVGCIRGLRQELAEADANMYSTAAAVKGLQARRENLQDTLDITKGLEEVVATQQALDVMLEGQDYAGALDLLEQLRSLLQQPQLMGLQCLRHLPPRLMDMAAAVDGALANEFLTTVANPDVGRIAAEAAADADAHPDASVSPDGTMASASVWHLTDPAATAAAADEQLTEKLLPLAVGLYRSEALAPTLQQYKCNAGEEVKEAVREVVQQVLPVLLSSCGDSLPLQGGGGHGEVYAWEQVQFLHHGAFMVLLYAAARVIFSCIHHTVRVGKVLEAILAGVNTPHSEAVRVLKACSVAVQVAADVGLGRWVKLLNARSAAHTRVKQYELKQILDLSEQVCEYVESVGARPLSSFRLALQGQCKSLLDASHSRNMQQLQGLLEAEQWVAVDVPAGFQAIVDRLLLRCAEGAALLEGRQVPAGTSSHMRSSSGGGVGTYTNRSSAPGEPPASPAAAAAAAGSEEHQPVLHLCGKSFHLVNSALMLLKMVDEYMTLHDLMPQFGAEIVHRQLELLKLFNSQTAALVLGAGAMRTAGLRSISAKQLALSCQAIAMLSTLLQPLRAGCLALVSQPRRALLMPEYDRLLQDLTMHVDEVHSKLVDIMRDRLAAAMQALPAEVRAAAPSGGSASVSAPTPTIALLAKQLATLRAVLVPLLLREEVEFVFGAVSRSYSDALSDTFETLLSEPNSGWEQVVQINALTMLEAFRDLPLDPARFNNYSARLSTTYTKHFGLPPWDQQRLGHRLQQNTSSNTLQQQQQRQEQSQLPPPQQQQQQSPAMAPELVAAAAATAVAAAAAEAAEVVDTAGDAAGDTLTAVSEPASNGLHAAPDSTAAAAAAAAAAAGGGENGAPAVSGADGGDADMAAAAAAAGQQLPQDSRFSKQLAMQSVKPAAAEQQPTEQLEQQKDLQQQQQQQEQQQEAVRQQSEQHHTHLLQQQAEQPSADLLQQQQDHHQQQQAAHVDKHMLQLHAQAEQQQQQQQGPSAQFDTLLHGQPGSRHDAGAASGGASNGTVSDSAAAAAAAAVLLPDVAEDSQQQQSLQHAQQHALPSYQQQQQELPLHGAPEGANHLDSSSLAAPDFSRSNGLHPHAESTGTAGLTAAAADGVDIGDSAAVAAPAASAAQSGGEVDLLSGLGLSQPASGSSLQGLDSTAAPPAAPQVEAAGQAAAAAVPSSSTEGLSLDAVGFMDTPPAEPSSNLGFMDSPAAAAAADTAAASAVGFLDTPPPADTTATDAAAAALGFMDTPPGEASSSIPGFMDGPPPAAAAAAAADTAADTAADAVGFLAAPPSDVGLLSFLYEPPDDGWGVESGWGSGGMDLMDQLGTLQLGEESTGSAADTAGAAATEIPAAAAAEVPAAAAAAEVPAAAAGEGDGAGSSPLDLLDAELAEVGLGGLDGGWSGGGEAAELDLHADNQQQQQQQHAEAVDALGAGTAVEQQQQQQQQQRSAQHHQRPEHEFYASLLQPDSPSEQQDMQDSTSSINQDAAQHSMDPAPAAVEPAASSSWDPLGVSVSAPPPEVVLEGTSSNAGAAGLQSHSSRQYS